jgi:hypothetical protein
MIYAMLLAVPTVFSPPARAEARCARGLFYENPLNIGLPIAAN